MKHSLLIHKQLLTKATIIQHAAKSREIAHQKMGDSNTIDIGPLVIIVVGVVLVVGMALFAEEILPSWLKKRRQRNACIEYAKEAYNIEVGCRVKCINSSMVEDKVKKDNTYTVKDILYIEASLVKLKESRVQRWKYIPFIYKYYLLKLNRFQRIIIPKKLKVKDILEIIDGHEEECKKKRFGV